MIYLRGIQQYLHLIRVATADLDSASFAILMNEYKYLNENALPEIHIFD